MLGICVANPPLPPVCRLGCLSGSGYTMEQLCLLAEQGGIVWLRRIAGATQMLG